MSQTTAEKVYFIYDEIDNPVVGSCPVCGGEAFLAEAAQAAQVVESQSDEPLDIPEGLAWCPTCEKAVEAVPENEED
ncbi:MULTISPECIES: hypothetical protein [Hymenobacter]|uniref:Uncharacterized protein n=1 Tax=Hymenobacter guriensis TaxID=2793065 RepID=A0ABS0L4C8_9BACT|nr:MULTISPECIES: hypothetical protein [Hymenobacter]MBG8554977.1 hypothetical protein [Hymenobacter guriensis]MCR5890430.1 hypothetical protein [Hymenobacter sp. J193]